ncbi:hypothetical protein NBRC116602_11990 [Hyphomicrobiales bacterium 4NK60-0047b]
MSSKTKVASDANTAPVEKRVKFDVSLWLTDLNMTEIGIYQQDRYRAKSRQFTKDMDILGEVKEDGKRVGLVAYRKGAWKKETGMKRRMVIKLFTDEVNWRGTMDLLLGRSMQLTHGAKGFPVTAYSMNISKHEQLVQMERSSYKWFFQPERYSFFILREGVPKFYYLRRCWINIGDDYVLYDGRGEKVGKLNGRILNLGGKWKCWVKAEHCDAEMKYVLQLFCTMLRFNDEAQHHVQDLVKDMASGKLKDVKLESLESDLYMNPRRVR